MYKSKHFQLIINISYLLVLVPEQNFHNAQSVHCQCDGVHFRFSDVSCAFKLFIDSADGCACVCSNTASQSYSLLRLKKVIEGDQAACTFSANLLTVQVAELPKKNKQTNKKTPYYTCKIQQLGQ